MCTFHFPQCSNAENGAVCRLLSLDCDKASNLLASTLWPLGPRLSKDGYQGCYLVTNFKLLSTTASSWVISHLMNLLSLLTPPTLQFNLGPKSNSGSWKGGVYVFVFVCVCVCVCEGQDAVFFNNQFPQQLISSKLERSFILNDWLRWYLVKWLPFECWH